jgi:hypothetical protein
MIKLTNLLEARGSSRPDPSLVTWLHENRVVSVSDWLYHGTPLEGLKNMIIHGIHGDQHGEVSEYNAFSTSFNSEVLHYFSDGEVTTGLQFKVENAKVLVLDEIMTYLVTQLAGSGMDAEITDEEAFEKFVKTFKVPSDNWKQSYYLPYDYITSIGVDAFMYDYVWKRWDKGMSPSHQDESEICFVGKGFELLNKSVSGIWVYDHEYELSEKEEALRDIEARI